MLIGKLASITDLSRDTIRYYESMGLLEAAERNNRFNNYKDYPQINVERLKMIKHLQTFGFTLREISAMIKSMKREDFDCRAGVRVLENKMQSVDAEISQLTQARSQLQETISEIKNNPGVKKVF